MGKISYRSDKSTDHFTCISVNVIYCITCTLCKIYTGETGNGLAGRFREHLRDVEKNDTDGSKPVARQFNLPNHSHRDMTIFGLFLHHGTTESHKKLRTKIHLSIRYTLSTRDQRTLFIPLIYSQIHVTIFPPTAKLIHTPI